MKLRFFAAFALAAASLSATPAHAAKGVVVAKCRDWMVVSTNMGFALLQWFGGNDPSRGDTLVGDYENYGMKGIFNLSADKDVKVWVEDYWLSKDRAIEKFSDKCDR